MFAELVRQYWKPLAGFIAGGFLAWYATSSVYQGELLIQEKTLRAACTSAQNTAVTEQKNLCSQSMKVANDASQNYQNDLADLERRYAERLRQPASCIPITHPAAGAPRPQPAANGGEVRPGGGISSDALLDATREGRSCARQVNRILEFYESLRDISTTLPGR